MCFHIDFESRHININIRSLQTSEYLLSALVVSLSKHTYTKINRILTVVLRYNAHKLSEIFVYFAHNKCKLNEMVARLWLKIALPIKILA